LGHGNQEALLSDFVKPSVTGITKAMKFPSISEASLNGLAPSFIQLFAFFSVVCLFHYNLVYTHMGHKKEKDQSWLLENYAFIL
jgi:hypothetical protein